MSAADARFIPLAELLRPPVVEKLPEPELVPDVCEIPAALPELALAVETADALRAARIFRAVLADTLDAVCARLVRELAADVLARELRLVPADISAIIQRLIAECLDQPVRVRVAPSDAQVICEFPVVADVTLQPGDAILECVHGSVDARLGIRLADVLAKVTP
jgi:hypothetical protein